MRWRSSSSGPSHRPAKAGATFASSLDPEPARCVRGYGARTEGVCTPLAEPSSAYVALVGYSAVWHLSAFVGPCRHDAVPLAAAAHRPCVERGVQTMWLRSIDSPTPASAACRISRQAVPRDHVAALRVPGPQSTLLARVRPKRASRDARSVLQLRLHCCAHQRSELRKSGRPPA